MEARILKAIDAEAIARDTLDFVSVKSETGDEEAGSLFLADLLRREGFDPELDEVESGRHTGPPPGWRRCCRPSPLLSSEYRC